MVLVEMLIAVLWWLCCDCGVFVVVILVVVWLHGGKVGADLVLVVM